MTNMGSSGIHSSFPFQRVSLSPMKIKVCQSNASEQNISNMITIERIKPRIACQLQAKKKYKTNERN